MKERRSFIRKLAVVGGLLAMTSSRNAINGISGTLSPVRTEGIGGAFVHTVFFWLADKSRETEERFVAELLQFVNHVDEIKTKHVGTPADTKREVIDNTFSYCLVVTFDSKKAHDVYQEHPLHEQFIENASELWDRVLVYDSISI